MTKEVKKGVPFWICLIGSLALLVAGFFVPPMGIIDGSVLKGASLLLAFGALAQIPVIIQVAGYVKMTKDDVTIEVKGIEHKND